MASTDLRVLLLGLSPTKFASVHGLSLFPVTSLDSRKQFPFLKSGCDSHRYFWKSFFFSMAIPSRRFPQQLVLLGEVSLFLAFTREIVTDVIPPDPLFFLLFPAWLRYFLIMVLPSRAFHVSSTLVIGKND